MVFSRYCTFTSNCSILQIMDTNVTIHPSPRPTSVLVPGLEDCSPTGGVKSTSEVGTNPPPLPDLEFDITVSNLPEKLGISPEFQAELEAVGGNVNSLTTKLLNSHNLADSGKFKVGQLCAILSSLSFIPKHSMLAQW